jgi:hypothetical protein
LKRNGIQIDGEGIENLLVNMVLWKRHIFIKPNFRGKVVEGVGLKKWSIENTRGSNPSPSVSGVIN